MQALFDLHKDLLDMYAYHVEACGALHHWREKLKGLRKHSKNPNPKIFFGNSDPQ